MHQLIDKIFVAAFDNPDLETDHDGAVITPGSGRIALTTDSYVVDPLFFPGGDIGSLAVNGTVNDLAMCGARPQYLTAGFILEEGLPTESLWRIAQSMRRAADMAGVKIVTGDTKVVEKGRGHGVYLNTAGVGLIDNDLNIGPKSIQSGDAIVISGDIGRHGIAIMAEREGLSFETGIESDCAPLVEPVMKLIEAGIDVHCLRDLTRGGLATALVEIARTSQCRMVIDESEIPVREEVRGACEILGFDPFYVANEGRMIAIVPEESAVETRDILDAHSPGNNASIIGKVARNDTGIVTLKSAIGTERILDMLSGEQLPRIC
jgi:hydrogenase expression/formation protein HypE